MRSGAPAVPSSRAAADGHPRRAELAAFLRSRRERVTPEQAGLPPGRRRRTPGLRREEVAQLAGVGVTWYTWLEQGRPINASVQVLTAIARTLLLDQAERDHLFRLADQPGAGADGPGASCEQLTPEVQGILDALVPLPASIQNERFDLLAWNRAYQVVWPSVTDSRPGDRNTLWLNFTHADCCHPYVNREEQLATLVAQFRGAYGRHVGEPAWTGFVRRLQAASPRFAQLWDEHDVASPGTYLKVFRHPAYERLAMTSTGFAVQSAPGMRLIVYTPADEVTRDAIRRLLAGEGAGARFPCWEEHRRRLAELPAEHSPNGSAAPDPDLAPSA
ncbi:MAG: helix-turn-helix domain-containing protein [Actinobacteria bacterium]|nr:helix-turn-helix domain-containing protein [Actinomycetota bacterium]